MAKCSVCESETLLYVNNKPLCSACDADRSHPGLLYRQVTAAKAEFVALSKQFGAPNKELVAGTHGIPYPDSVGIVESLGARIRASFHKCRVALTAYIDAIKKR